MKMVLFLVGLFISCTTATPLTKYQPQYQDCVQVESGFYKGLKGIVADKYGDSIYVIYQIIILDGIKIIGSDKYVSIKEVFIQLPQKECGV